MNTRVSPSETVVVIPTYDERDNIRDVLDQVLAAADVDILVVDDNSPDGTADLVRQHVAFGRRVHLVVRPEKAGLGAAYREGFGWALDRGYHRIVQMDADLSHPPTRVPALVAALDNHDVAVGSRYVSGGGARNWPLSRRLISWLGNLYVRLVLGIRVHDTTAGFKAFRSSALETIDVLGSESNGYCFQIENTWRAVRAGLRVVEVPIVFTDRSRGSSKMSSAIVAEALTRVVGWRLVGDGRRVPEPTRVAA